VSAISILGANPITAGTFNDQTIGEAAMAREQPILAAVRIPLNPRPTQERRKSIFSHRYIWAAGGGTDVQTVDGGCIGAVRREVKEVDGVAHDRRGHRVDGEAVEGVVRSGERVVPNAEAARGFVVGAH
jgi:hypothetical protein